MEGSLKRCIAFFVVFLYASSDAIESDAAERVERVERTLHSSEGVIDPPDLTIIAESGWQEIERSVDRGITWLVKHQKTDGSYAGLRIQRTGITGLAAMAMISRGHVPGQGAEGLAINRSIDFILKTQKSNGLLSDTPEDLGNPEMGPNAIMYSHGICGLFLCEVYGNCGAYPSTGKPRTAAAGGTVAQI